MTTKDLIKALGERGIALWSSGDLSASFTPFQEAVERLLAFKKKDDDWKTLIVLLGHALGYLSNLAKHDQPPQFARGGLPYEPPARGIFLICNPDVIANYMEAHISYLPTSLVSFAEGLGKDEDATKWALRAFDIAKEAADKAALSTVGLLALGYLIRNDRFYEAFDVARDVGVTTVAIKTIGPDRNDYLVHGFDAYTVLGEKPNEKWEEAESYTALLGLIPVMFRISTVKLTDPDQAANSASLAARACREVAQVSAIPDLWNSAAELFEELFKEEIDPEKLIAKGKRFDVKLQLALKTICYVRASLECTPQHALEIHLAIMPFLSEHFLPFVSLYRQTLLPFLQTFWLKAVRESGFYFSNPRSIKSQLEQMINAHDETTVQNLLSIITTGLAVQVDESTSRWLDQR